jgi:hypothetical protein
MTDEIKLCEKVKDEYLYSLNAIDGNVILHFKDLRIVFKSYLIFKNGYPNDEVYSVQEKFVKNHLMPSVLYQIVNSAWVNEIKKINRVHPRHEDKLFDKAKHFLIFFQDETFECIADSYEVQH